MTDNAPTDRAKASSPDVTGELADQAREQADGQQIRLHIDEREMTTSYANAYRTHLTNEEVLIDFGLNLASPAPKADGENGAGPTTNVLFRASNRVILNYPNAKRLAMTLGQAIRQYEQRFGEIKLNANERHSGQA